MLSTTRPPLLTIVIPTINRAELVSRAIDSALAQTCEDIEIIVSNNGSTDETRAVLDRYSDPRLRIFHRDTTIPACAHGNFLIGQTRSELFLGLSDDDFLEPEFASSVVDLFARHSSIAFAYTGCHMHYADVSVLAKTGPEVERGPDFIAAFLAGRRDVCWCACVTRTSMLHRIGPIPSGLIFGDMFYWTKLAFQGDVGCVEAPLSHYIAFRDSGDNITGGTPVVAWASETQSLVEKMVEGYSQAERDPEFIGHVRRDGEEFLARSTADQFVWNALRGMNRIKLVRSVLPSLPFLKHGPLSLWIRVAASLAAPRSLLRSRVLAAARRKAEELQREPPQPQPERTEC